MDMVKSETTEGWSDLFLFTAKSDEQLVGILPCAQNLWALRESATIVVGHPKTSGVETA